MSWPDCAKSLSWARCRLWRRLAVRCTRKWLTALYSYRRLLLCVFYIGCIIHSALRGWSCGRLSQLCSDKMLPLACDKAPFKPEVT